jgi:hypothetical protein
MFKYLKYYFEPTHKEMIELALQSWRLYIQGRPRIYNMDVCRAYQRGFISSYRSRYAREKLESLKS